MEVDPEVVRAAQRGEAGAMDALIRATYADVYALCRRLPDDPADAADATQEVYVRVVRSVLGFRAEAAFGTWLHRVTVNVCATALRRRGDARSRGQVAGHSPFAAPDSPDVFASGDDTEERFAARDHARRVTDAIVELPADAREVVELSGCPARRAARRPARAGGATGRARKGGGPRARRGQWHPSGVVGGAAHHRGRGRDRLRLRGLARRPHRPRATEGPELPLAVITGVR